MSSDETDYAGPFPRRVPAIITYLHPFRMIENEALERWSASIEQINKHEWDYVKLHDIVGGLDVHLAGQYPMLIGRDGALALPPLPKLCSDQEAVEFFNRCLAAFLLGGVYCTAVSLDNLEFGSIIDGKYIRSYGGQAGVNQFHAQIRMKMAAPLSAISLLSPPILDFKRLAEAAAQGFALLASVPRLSPEFLLKGVSGIARRDWGVALSNLWISVEQLTEALWQRDILGPAQRDEDGIAGRATQLKDPRTWSAATRQELLYSKGVLPEAALRHLFLARKARNELSHRGTHPTEAAAQSAYAATLALLKSAVGQTNIPLTGLDLADHSLSDPFSSPKDVPPLDPQYWMPFPKLPGEEELEEGEAREHRHPPNDND